uniref:Uncharacterized protein n=1 Tax=Rhizophora mucronata TaxID=61149 RepID=A0A2P2MPZ3_RHIMU
MEVSAARL